MRRIRLRVLRLPPALIVLTTLAAGCAGAIPSTQGGPATVKPQNSKLGQFLVDRGGHSLYLFTRDEKNDSYCYGACAAVWPPYETNGQLNATGVPSSSLGTFKRDDGDRQVTYNGHPLYYYAGDASKSGRTSGEGLKQFGAEWYLVSRDGKKLEEEKGGGS